MCVQHLIKRAVTMSKELCVALNTGAKMPMFGLGTFNSKPGEVGAAVEAALRAGYRLIDCAHLYGNEAEIGEALQKCFKEGVVKREDVFITSKLWSTDHAREDVIPACQTSLKKLQLDYLDLYLIHFPVALRKGVDPLKCTDDDKLGYDPDQMAKTWEGMEELVKKGLVKAIGISNFSITKTERLLQTAKIVPAVNQVECHPYFQQQKLKEYCDSKGIILEVYSPMMNPGSPIRTADVPNLLEDPAIKEIAAKHNATVGQVCIAFPILRGLVVIPKTVTPARITENFKSTELKLDAEDMRRLRELDRNYRMVHGEWFLKSGESVDELWNVQEDEKFVVAPPDAKKQKTEE